MTGTASAGSATVLNVMRSEWTKLHSVRSTLWTLLAMFLVTVGLSTLISWGVSSTFDQTPPQARARFDPTSISLAGLSFGQLAVAVLGVMVIASEYSTGGIRTTLTAVPRRLRVLFAKAAVLGAVALLSGTITSLASFTLGQFILSTKDLDVSLGEPGVLRAVIGGGLYLAASGMFGFALGAMLRSTAGAITVAAAGLVVLPILTNLIPGDVGDFVQRYFTSNAGQQITAVRVASDALTPWTGYLVFCMWWAVILATAAVQMTRRDA